MTLGGNSDGDSLESGEVVNLFGVDQNREQVRDLLDRVDASTTLPDELKKYIKKQCEVSVREHMYKPEQLRRMFMEYEKFIKTKNEIFGKRDEILFKEVQGIPLWGGEPMSFRGKTYPSSNTLEQVRWSIEYLEPLFEGFISIGEAKKRMGARMRELKKLAKDRVNQAKGFTYIRDLLKSKGVKSSLFSKTNFVNSSYEKRRGILLRIADIGRAEGDEFDDWSKDVQKDFFEEMEGLHEKAKTSSPPESWDIYREMYSKLLRMGISQKVAYRGWVEIVKEGLVRNETKIGTQVAHIRRNVRQFSIASDVSVEQEAMLYDYLDYLSGIPFRLKLKAGIGGRLINAELAVNEVLDKRNNSIEVPESSVDKKEILLNKQLDNEFLRRIFQLIVAYAMSRGSNVETSQKAQQELLETEENAIAKDAFLDRQNEYMEDFVAEKSDNAHVQMGDEYANFDTVSAVKESGDSIEVENKKEGMEVSGAKELEQKHAMKYWEITRVASLRLAPPEANERYLRSVMASGQHLTLTNNYMVVNMREAERVLKGRVVENVNQLPGENSKDKRGYLLAMFSFIDEAKHADKDFVNRVFNKTTMHTMDKAA